VRWFQFGATCPLFRQHGARDTAPWGYGNESYAAIVKVIAWRDAQRDYVMAQMAIAAATGMPVNRPLWVRACARVRACTRCSTVFCCGGGGLI
jgi:alpha-glucosidase (family GH31 glycosyl hydrolase)